LEFFGIQWFLPCPLKLIGHWTKPHGILRFSGTRCCHVSCSTFCLSRVIWCFSIAQLASIEPHASLHCCLQF
jgi:hypothetical protein